MAKTVEGPAKPRLAVKGPRHRFLQLCGALILVCFAIGWIRPQHDAFAVCSGFKSTSIYTVNEADSLVQCIVVHDSRIASTGSLAKTWACMILTSIRRLARPRILYIKPGSIVVPGLADAHAHIMDYGRSKQIPLESAASVDDVVQILKRYIIARPDVYNDSSRRIEGMGWDQTKWEPQEFPTAADLDRDPILRGRPIVLHRIDGHACWVSTRVLEQIAPLPDQIPGGIIPRDPQGRPTGVFVDKAMDLIPSVPASKEQMAEFFGIAMDDAVRYGLTSIHDAATLPNEIEFYKEKAERAELPIRLYLMGYIASDNHNDWVGKFPRLIGHGVHARLNVRSVKLFADGALGSWGAAMLEPYSDKPETDGILRFEPAVLTDLVRALSQDGWQVNIHCIGDRANKVVLDIFEDILEGDSGDRADVNEWRPRIEHAQIMRFEDMQRCGRLGVIPSVQPTHATSDMWYAETRLGPERVKRAYAYQTQFQASRDNTLPLGSDAPVEGINPLLGFYAAVSRLDVTGSSPHGSWGWFPEETLTRIQALKGMTLDAAYASFAENDLGSLEPGKKADFVVLDSDIMTIPVHEILNTKVLATVVDGKLVYGAL